MHSLGRLGPSMSRRLLRSGWVPFVLLDPDLCGDLGVRLCYPVGASSLLVDGFRSTRKTELMQLLIPSNPFAALRENTCLR